MSSYEAFEAETKTPSNERFKLHSHDNYEMLLFLEGDVSYMIEGKAYNLSPGDIILVRKHQLHRAYHNTPKKYRRIVINITHDFFTENNCLEYEEQFINESLKSDNKLSASVARKSGIYDAVMRFEKYTDNFSKEDSPIYVSSIMEILYLLSEIEMFSEAEKTNPQFSMVMEYINEHFCEDVTLELISEEFYISKYHLCRLFKKKTGLTFHQYLNKKRLDKLQELIKEGNSITDAAILSGFKSYAAFYRVYMREFGIKPKEGLKR